MAQRTTTLKVQEILGDNWAGSNVQPYIDIASSIVDQANTLAFSAKGFSLTPTQLELMERWLAAHFYCTMDPIFMQKATDGASGSFQRKVGDGFDATDYGKAACNVDTSGVLTAIGKRQFASGFGDPGHCRNNPPLYPRVNGISPRPVSPWCDW
jgi:hypothetical protein